MFELDGNFIDISKLEYVGKIKVDTEWDNTYSFRYQVNGRLFTVSGENETLNNTWKHLVNSWRNEIDRSYRSKK